VNEYQGRSPDFAHQALPLRGQCWTRIMKEIRTNFPIILTRVSTLAMQYVRHNTLLSTLKRAVIVRILKENVNGRLEI
jgi:hypothetical protein